jgi:hypothetical protein
MQNVIDGTKPIILFLMAIACNAGMQNIAIAKPAHVTRFGTPIAIGTQNHPLVRAIVNDHPAWFIVDTGAPVSVIDIRKASVLQLSTTERFARLPKQLVINNRETPIAYLNHLQIGSDDLGAGPVALVDLRGVLELDRVTNAKLDFSGIIGMDVLQKYAGLIDHRDRQILFGLSQDDLEAVIGPTSEYHRVPMRLTARGALEIEGFIGRNMYSFIADTGSFMTLIPYHVALQNQLPIRWDKVWAKQINLQPTPVGQAIVPEFMFENYDSSRAQVHVTVMPHRVSDLPYPYGGQIGSDFFLNHGALIDVANRALYIR